MNVDSSKSHAREVYESILGKVGTPKEIKDGSLQIVTEAQKEINTTKLFQNLSQIDRLVAQKALEIIQNPNSTKKLNATETKQFLNRLNEIDVTKDSGITSRLVSNYFKNSFAGAYLGLSGIESQNLVNNFNIALKSTTLMDKIDILIPKNKDTKIQTVSSERQNFLMNHLKDSKMDLIFLQNKNYPIIQTAIRELSENYKKWDQSLSKNELFVLKQQLEVQHKNLLILSNILNNFDESVSKELAVIEETVNVQYDKTGEKAEYQSQHNIQAPHITESYLAPYIKGEKPLDEKTKQEIVKKITSGLNDTNKSIKPLSSFKEISKELESKRAQSPITKKAIEQQAGLFAAERESKAFAAQQTSLTPRGDSANIVIEMKKMSEDSEVAAFYKEGKGNEKAAGIMEKLMWDMSLVMGLEELFTATKDTSIQTKAQPGQRTEKGKVWSKNGELIEQNDLVTKRHGGIQAAQGGTTLEKLQLEGKQISKEQVIKGTLATLVFGMYDAHSRNILVNEEGNLKFFDNTRSMPNSNGVIFWGGSMLSSYRSGLLGLNESQDPLTNSERKMMKQDIEKMKSKIENLEKFLNNPATKSQITQLPPGWWSQEDSLSAMKERVNNLEVAINNPEVKSLRDLVFATNPDFKFFAAMQTLMDISKLNIPLKYLEGNLPNQIPISLMQTGFVPIDTLINTMSKLGVDTEKIQALCQNPNLSFEASLREIINLYRKAQFLTVTERDKLKLNGENIINNYSIKAHIDYKDINNSIIKNKYTPQILGILSKIGLTTYQLTKSQIDEHLDRYPPPYHFVTTDGANPPTLTLNYKTGTETNPGVIKKIDLNYMIKLGFLKIGDLLVTPNELQAAFMNAEKPEILTPLQVQLGIFD